MIMPKEMNKYCPKCKKATLHKVVQNKSGKKRGIMKQGSRRFESKTAGYTGFPKPKPENSKRRGAKTTKKVDLRFVCKECNKAYPIKQGFRAKKIEWEAAK